MCHQNERASYRAMNASQLFVHLQAELEVKGAERLIEQQHLGLVDQRPSYGHALALATAQFVDLSRSIVFKLDEAKHFGDLAIDLGTRDFLYLQPKCDVLRRGEMWSNARCWKIILVRRRCGGSFATLRPPMRISPSSGSSKPPIIRRSVVLPQPLGPRSEKNSPRLMSSDT